MTIPSIIHRFNPTKLLHRNKNHVTDAPGKPELADSASEGLSDTDNESLVTSADTAKTMSFVRSDIIGAHTAISTPFGQRKMLYCDFVASGRAMQSIETFIQDQVLTSYANTHTDMSATGRRTNHLREEARGVVADACGVDRRSHAVIFTGSGVTSAIDTLLQMLPAPFQLKGGRDARNPSDRPVVFTSPYEHHSNILPWRESNCDVITCKLNTKHGIDLDHLRQQLDQHKDRPMIIGSFSAASNVDGTLTDVAAVTKLVHEFGGVAFWDYAAAGPYVPIDVEANQLDAVFLSPHKFVGGPGTPGVLIMRRSLDKAKMDYANTPPHRPGGGTVQLVTRDTTVYLQDIEMREESGTPDIVGSIRAGAVFKLKQEIGDQNILDVEHAMLNKALKFLTKKRCPNLCILGDPDAERLPTLSFVVIHNTWVLHQNFICALLNDLFGIQSRSGCACAGPYGVASLGISEPIAQALRQYLDFSVMKPGFTRLNLPFFATDEEIDYILDVVAWVSNHAYKLLPLYKMDPVTGSYTHVQSSGAQAYSATAKDLSSTSFLKTAKSTTRHSRGMASFAQCFKDAEKAVKMVQDNYATQARPSLATRIQRAAEIEATQMAPLPQEVVWFLQRDDVVQNQSLRADFDDAHKMPLFMPPRYRPMTKREQQFRDSLA